LNGSVSQGTIGGNTYYEMSKTAIIGTNADFTINADGYIAQFVTDAGDPALLNIPGGNWNFEMFFSASSGGGSPSFYVELYKYDGTTLTLIASDSTNPESITGGTATDLYITALAVPTTTLTLTDRLAIRVYVLHSGRTITLHTQNGNLCQIITTFTTGLTALNGLTAQVQNFAVGTSGSDFNISSVTDTHTFNLPTASSTKRGALSAIDWAAFDAKVDFGDLSATSPLNYNGSGLFTIAQSSASTNGYLSSADWTTFNNKQNALTNPITGTGTTNYLPKFTGSTALGNSLLQETTNAIGLNVTPKAWGNNNKVLETTFSTSLIGRSDFSALGRNFFYNSGDDPIYSNNGFASGYFQADGEHLWVSAASGTAGNTISFAQNMTLKANGNLGIGTTTPAYKLDVNSGSSAISARFYSPSNDSTVVYVGGTANTTFSDLVLYSNSGTGEIFKAGTGYASYGGTLALNIFNSNGAIAFHPNSIANAMFIATNGNVGVGTTNPLYRLESTTTALFGTTAYGVLNIAGDNPAYIKIKTNIPFSYGGQGYTVNIKGFQYGGSQTLDLQVCWHQYADAFYSQTVTSKGSFAPVVRLARESGLVVIVLTWGQYWPKLYVESVHNYVNDGYANGWTWVDENVTGDKVATLSYKNDFGDGFVKTSVGSVGIGTNAPGYQLAVSNGGAASIEFGTLNGNFGEIYTYNRSTAAFIQLKIDGSSLALNSSTGGNVLINTTTDAGYKLDVNGTARFTGQVISNTQFYAIGTPPVNSGALVNVRDTNADGSNISFGGVFFNSSPGNDYSIGKLTENSVGFLQIRNGNNGAELLRINNTGAATFASSVTAVGALFTSSTETRGTIRTTFTGDNSYYSLFSNDGALNLDTYGVGGSIYLKILGSTKFIIAASGNVLIGTVTDSGYKLDVNGTTRATKGIFSGSTGETLTAQGIAGEWTANFRGAAATGNSYGLGVFAGTNASDIALAVYNQAITSELFIIKGNGAAAFGSSVTATSFSNAGLQSGEVFNATKLNAGYFVAYLQNTSASGYGLYIQNGSNSLPAIRISNAAGTVNAINLYGSGIAEFSSSVTATNFIVPGGTSAQFLKADGSLDSNVYLTSTSSTFSYTSSVTLSPTWQNTGVSSTNLGTGAYLVTCNANDFGVGGGQYDCTYTGIMYFFAGTTNGSNANEIVLHHSGHADNGRYIYLRTLSTVSADGKTYLQISGNGTNSGASNYQFTFKKLL